LHQAREAFYESEAGAFESFSLTIAASCALTLKQLVVYFAWVK